MAKLEHQQSTRKMLSNQNSNDSVRMQKRWNPSEKSVAILFTIVASLGYVSVGTMVAWSCNSFSKLLNYGRDFSLGFELGPTRDDGVELSDNQRYSLAATPALAAAISAVVVYKLYYLVGTKMFMLTAATLAIVGNFLLSFGTSFWYFSAGRALAGISAGIIFTLVPPYVDEFGSKQYKPLLDGILHVHFALGILIQFMAGLLPFTQLYGVISSAFPIFLFIGFLFLPESARYLCATEQVTRARIILTKTHSNDALSVQIMENSLNNWQQSKLTAVNLLDSLRNLQNTRIVVPTLVLIVFQQFIGAIPMMFYLTRIFTLTDGQYTPEWTAIYVGTVFTLAIPAYQLLGLKIGDYKLLVSSSLLMSAAMAGLGWHCHAQGMHGHSDEYGHVPLVCFAGFIFLYAISYQRIPWKWLSESVEEENGFPLHAIATAISWGSLYFCVRLLPTLIGLIGVGWLFWNITIVLLFAMTFLLVSLPNPDQGGVRRKTLAECSSGSSSTNLETMEAVV
ncbi:facilitated trehalose transporter Tret1 isoform X4 [Topomyia yanbarensis]|uniref:facilitated trehalose transporter Tret1 isoform X4 n=1 Tax=Topomyia yanbarensis TaxID=2498891 RepID=UPI00273CA339|nr:facilitated trehalose transporter Tret1 isoform X4 [Topomyia yanbarensis]